MTYLPETQQPQSLHTILTALEDHEKLVERMADPDLIPPAETIIEDLKDKVDRIYGFRLALDHAADAMDSKIKALKETRDRIESNRKRIDAILVWNMQHHGAEKLPGNEVRAQIQYSTVCEPLSPTPQLADCALWPQFVRTKYEWDKPAIKKANDTGVDVGALAEVKKSPHVRFYPTTKVLEGKK
jgi:hypothetical protein